MRGARICSVSYHAPREDIIPLVSSFDTKPTFFRDQKAVFRKFGATWIPIIKRKSRNSRKSYNCKSCCKISNIHQKPIRKIPNKDSLYTGFRLFQKEKVINIARTKCKTALHIAPKKPWILAHNLRKKDLYR